MKIKRGDTFHFSGLMPSAFPAGNWSATCNVVGLDGVAHPIVATLTPPNVENPRMLLTLHADAAATALWPVGTMKGDVQFADATDTPPHVQSSKTFKFTVLQDQTQ